MYQKPEVNKTYLTADKRCWVETYSSEILKNCLKVMFGEDSYMDADIIIYDDEGGASIVTFKQPRKPSRVLKLKVKHSNFNSLHTADMTYFSLNADAVVHLNKATMRNYTFSIENSGMTNYNKRKK